MPDVPQPRPWIPVKTWYLELDGEPSCRSRRHPLARPGWTCAHGSHEEARRAALLVWRDHPDCVVAIREGPCPRDPEEETGCYSRYDEA